MRVALRPMTDEMYESYFREYENDPDLYFDKAKYVHYVYSPETVQTYIDRQKQKKRIPFAIMAGEEIVGEILLKDIVEQESATISIAMKNTKYKDKGYGTQAERLAVQYAFEVLGVKTVYADFILTNTRSQRVLEKVCFTEISRDEMFVYYKIERTAHT